MRYLKIRKCIKENDMEELMLQFRKLEYDNYQIDALDLPSEEKMSNIKLGCGVYD